MRRLRDQAARANRYWVEVEESALVRRPPAYYVDAESDELFIVYRVAIFATGQA
jgi:hypothetical protein